MKIRNTTPLLIAASSLAAVIASSCAPGGGQTGGSGGSSSAGTGGTVGAGGAASGSGGASTDVSSGGSSFVIPASGGAEMGAGGEPPIQNGGLVPLTTEQAAAIASAECAGVSSQAEKIPAVLEFVIDVSTSMGYDTPNTNGARKWDLALPALLAALDALPDSMAVGLQVFPTADATFMTGGDICADASGRVAIAPLGPPGGTQRTVLAGVLNDPMVLQTGTPTHDAYVNGLDLSLRPYAGAGNKFMLLMTDGLPTQEIGCGALNSTDAGSPTQPIIDAIAAAQAEGIGTFIIGAPGTEGDPTAAPGSGAPLTDTRPWLSQAAMVGGSGPDGCTVEGPNFCHFDMTQAPDFSVVLAEGLAAIADKVSATCTFQMPPAPEGESIDPDLTSVMITHSDGTAVLAMHDADADCTEGWVWGADGEIVLCAATCAGIEADPGANVSVSLGCSAEDIIIILK